MTEFFCVDSPFVAYCFLEAKERLPNGVRARVRLRPQLANSWGGAHGGLIVTLLDASMTVAARYALDSEGRQPVATIDLSTSFLGQAKQEIVCEATVAAKRGRTIYAEARARNETGEMIARAIGTLRAM